MGSLAEIVPKVGVLMAIAMILLVPLQFRPDRQAIPTDAQRLVVISPHNEQIRTEFEGAFRQWHRQRFGQDVFLDWRFPGGTAEIRKLLVSIYTEAVTSGRIAPDGTMSPGAEPMPFDLLFGGGTFEHGEVKKGVTVDLDDKGPQPPITLPMSVPQQHPSSTLDEWFGENKVGASPLYDPGDPAKNDPGQFWIGTALSGFGIITNRDVLRELGVPEPGTWEGLCDPRLAGWISLADPRQSGSVATAYESILNSKGWTEGWKILRRMSANSRSFSFSSLKIPLEVAVGQAAAGVAIDFYGRYQSQALMKPGETPQTTRIGYTDPPGAAFVDPDPISILRGGPNPELARRFLEFVLSEEGQAIWNFPLQSTSGLTLGPTQFEIRRMPIRRMMFERHASTMIDKVNSYDIASTAPNKGWRSAIGPMMGAFAIDTHADLISAWRAINDAQARGADPALLAQAEALFDAMPTHTMKDGTALPFDEKNYRTIRADWREAEKDGRWQTIRMGYTSFFQSNYRQIVAMLESAARALVPLS